MEDKGLNISNNFKFYNYPISKVENSKKLTRSKSMDSIDFNFKPEQ